MSNLRPNGVGVVDPQNIQAVHCERTEGSIAARRNMKHFRMYDVCNNCGKQGHTFKQCKNPITSFGVIVFRVRDHQRQYLMIRRKDTLGYIDFLRGKYMVSNTRFVLNMLKQMTVREKNRLLNHSFDELWRGLWGGHDDPYPGASEDPPAAVSPQYKIEELNSREKFHQLSTIQSATGFSLLNDLVHESIGDLTDLCNCEWEEPEWGFPKGRRNYQETDYECAVREMTEETGYPAHALKNIHNILPFEEIFLGSNYKSYKHKYYLMYMNYEDTLSMENYEKSEVSCMEWKTYEECMASIRFYNLEKKRIITNIEKTLADYHIKVC